MYNPWVDATLLAMQAAQVVTMRTVAPTLGGPGAEDETRLMVTEKIAAHATAARTLMAGGSLQSVIAGYRDVVEANAARLLTP